MNFLENFLLNQKPKEANLPPLQTPEQVAQNREVEQQRQGLAERLMQPTSLMNGINNFLIHPKNALFGMKSNDNEVPVSYQQPLVGVDMTQSDYDHAKEQGLLPENPMIIGGVKENPRIGGLLQDFAGGFKDNAQNGFKLSNLEDNTTDYGGKKGLAYHAGEIAGTIGRGLNSSGGRGLMTGIGVLASGGNPNQAIQYGLQAGLGNYNNVQQDKMNRNLLEANGIDTSNIRGYLNNDMAKSYTENMYKLNNANYRMGKLSIDQKEHLRKLGLTEAQIAKIEAETETEKQRPEYLKAQTGYTKARTNYTNVMADEAPKRTGIMGATVGQRRILNSLNIEQKKLINDMLIHPEKYQDTPIVNTNPDSNGYSF